MSRKEIQNRVQSARVVEFKPKDGGEPPPPAPGDRPRIMIAAGELPAMIAAAQAALIDNADAGPPIFQRGGELVRVGRVPMPTVRQDRRRQAPDALAVLPVNSHYLVARLTACAEWYKPDKRAASDPDKRAAGDAGPPALRRSNAPKLVADSLLSRAGEWRFPNLAGLVEAPTLRSDGSVLDRPGYDQATGLFFDPGDASFPKIPRKPSKREAAAALERLAGLLVDFPFAAGVDRSVALAALLTGLVRRSLPTAPLIGYSAPVMASGKSLLADLVALLATGRPVYPFAFGGDEAEFRKRLLPVLREGHAVVSIDNIEADLKSESLCIVLTQRLFSDRLLGASATLTVPTAVQWLATGNNLTVSGDLTTRTLLCNLDPDTERPGERTFAVDLLCYVPEHRPELVRDALAVMRAYIAADRPRVDVPNFARFEAWSSMVRAPLVWLGEADPCEALRQLEEADPVRAALREVLGCWHDVFRDRPVLAAHAARVADNLPTGDSALDADLINLDPARRAALHTALLGVAMVRGEINARRLGGWLRRYANRIEAALKIENAGEREHANLWRVVEHRPRDRGEL